MTSQEVEESRKCYLSDKNDPSGLYPVGIPQTTGVYDFSANTAKSSSTYEACPE
ncbi:hypothetical protein AVEN_8494-1, partial [Araneus ventricosus]